MDQNKSCGMPMLKCLSVPWQFRPVFVRAHAINYRKVFTSVLCGQGIASFGTVSKDRRSVEVPATQLKIGGISPSKKLGPGISKKSRSVKGCRYRSDL
jgi:hypothetical protein